MDSIGPSSPASTFSFGSQGPDSLSYLVSPTHLTSQLLAGSTFGLAASECSSSACSSRSSPRLDYFDPRKISNSNSFSMGFDTLELDTELNDFFPNHVDPFVEDGFSPCLPRVQTESDLPGWFETHRVCSTYGNNEPSSVYAQAHCLPTNMDFVNGSTNLNPSSSGKSAYSRHHFSTISQASQTGPTPFSPSSAHGNPTTEDLNQYCMSIHFFFVVSKHRLLK